MDFKKIKSLEAALKVKGLTMAIIAAMFANVPEEDRQEQILAYALNKGEDVINGDEKLDWTNTDQPKYWIWWDIVKKASGGFGLSLSDVRYAYTNAHVGARRHYASREKALHCAKIFKKHYEQEFFSKKVK